MTDISVRIQNEMAAADAAQTVGNHSGRAEHATNALKMLQSEYDAVHRPVPSAEPKTAVEAAARLAHLGQDQDFMRRFNAGDKAARQEFETLSEMQSRADPVEMALAGVAPPDGVDENMGATATGRDVVAGVKHLKDAGFADLNIRELLEGRLRTGDGKPLTVEEQASRVADAERALARAQRNPEFGKKLFGGDEEARATFDWLTAIIAAGKKS
jgi:hypothetical protein